jgi:hypothetical protein
LITTIFSDNSQVDMVKNLSGEDAQNVIDVIDEVSTCTWGIGWLTQAETSMLCQLGIGKRRTTNPQEVPALFT